MRLLVWGLGYVGTVTAACLAKLGHVVTGIEPNVAKVTAINEGQSAIIEPGLEALIQQMVAEKKFDATTNGVDRVAKADVSIVCVGTPSTADGTANVEHLRMVAKSIGEGLRNSERYHVIVIRSTTFPGLVKQELIPILEAESGRVSGQDFGVVVNPEFLRETSAIADFFAPPYTVIGELDQRSGDVIEELYRGIDVPVFRVTFDESALLKLANNAFHALKIGFANEIGRVCDALGIDSHTVMQMVSADTKLNISTAYMKPGFAFGGSCLPKDLRSLAANARRLNVELPILEAILPSNRLQVEAARIKVHSLKPKQVGVLGLSFKPGTDDLRESAILDLIRDLWRDGINVSVYDPDVMIERMLGSNFEYLERQLPQIRQIMCDNAEDVVRQADVVVISQKRDIYLETLQSASPNCTIIDLVRLGKERFPVASPNYQGISW